MVPSGSCTGKSYVKFNRKHVGLAKEDVQAWISHYRMFVVGTRSLLCGAAPQAPAAGDALC